MLGEKLVLKRKIYILLTVGGLIVAATFLVAWIFGIGTWEAWWSANFLHFIGGAYAFFFVRAIYEYAREKHKISAPRRTEIILFIAGALILGVFWEWFEFAIDRYRVLAAGKPSFMTYADNIGDLIIDTLGAACVAICFWKRGR